MRRIPAALFVAFLFLVLSPVPVNAHQDGCHRWHSCPSDTGSYVCGDLGHACQYPTPGGGARTTSVTETGGDDTSDDLVRWVLVGGAVLALGAWGSKK